MAANDTQHGGGHYRTKAIQVWDYVTANDIPYLEGNAIKYLSRWRDKGGVEDLFKCKHYVEKLIENAEAEQAAESAAGRGAVPACVLAYGGPTDTDRDMTRQAASWGLPHWYCVGHDGTAEWVRADGKHYAVLYSGSTIPDQLRAVDAQHPAKAEGGGK